MKVGASFSSSLPTIKHPYTLVALRTEAANNIIPNQTQVWFRFSHLFKSLFGVDPAALTSRNLYPLVSIL